MTKRKKRQDINPAACAIPKHQILFATLPIPAATLRTTFPVSRRALKVSPAGAIFFAASTQP